MKIIKMLMLQVGTHNDQFQRPYMAHVDNTTMQHLQEATSYGLNLTPAALGRVGADIMRVSSTVSGGVNIANGFDQPRLCFMMEVEFPGTAGIHHIEYLMGYTNHIGVMDRYGTGNSVVFDPNMELYFNNVMRGSRAPVTGSFGRTTHNRVNGAFQLITGDYRPSITNLHQTPHLMRPQDVYTSMSMENCRRMVGDDSVLDARPTHGPEKVAVSSRRNTIPGRYLSTMLEAWNAQNELDDVDPASVNSQLAAIVAEPTVSRIRSMQSLATVSELRQGGCVTWQELCDAEDSGTLEARTVVVLAQSDRTRANLSQRGTTEYWNGNGQRTVIATQFVQSVPGLMMELMLTELDFSVTNMTLDGEWQVMFQNVQSFNDGDNVKQVEAFRFNLCNQLMPGLSRGNLIPMEIHASFNVVGETLVEIKIDDDDFVPFMAPSFCDGLFAAVRAPDTQTLDRFADNLSRITSNLQQDHSAGGSGYEPSDDQFSSILNSRGNRYATTGTL